MSAVAPSICPGRTGSKSSSDPDQIQCSPQPPRIPRGLVRVGVRRAWPEEATETVTLGPGHDMHVQVNDALAARRGFRPLPWPAIDRLQVTVSATLQGGRAGSPRGYAARAEQAACRHNSCLPTLDTTHATTLAAAWVALLKRSNRWSWRESNPRPSAPFQGFSGCSLLIVFSVPVLAQTRRRQTQPQTSPDEFPVARTHQQVSSMRPGSGTETFPG